MMPLGMQEAGRFPPPFFPSLQAAVEQVTGKRMVGVIASVQSDTEDLERGGHSQDPRGWGKSSIKGRFQDELHLAQSEKPVRRATNRIEGA